MSADNNRDQDSGGILKWIMFGVILAVLAVTLSEGLRDRVLDALFGSEEAFNYEPTEAAQSADGASANGKATPPVSEKQTS
ncbi:MAG: hypothetical protein F2799_02920 [Actinobacteria bacterium]|uniref:Unannotated protein n=1 Tax=freshwater metagenome TaxID=449393 RepID=A0A6J7DBN1_9ZZZZ|nr:hypothetical protein [Actinomycetota bacterium]